MPFAKGTPKPIGSGRTLGVPSKAKVEEESAKQILARLGIDPIERMARIADGNVPCGVCMGTGFTKYQPGTALEDALTGETVLKERRCQSCWQSGKEKISPELRGKMLEILSRKIHPDLKAVEHSGTLGLTVSLAERLRLKREERLSLNAGEPEDVSRET